MNDWLIPNVTLSFDEMGSVYTAVISERGVSIILYSSLNQSSSSYQPSIVRFLLIQSPFCGRFLNTQLSLQLKFCSLLLDQNLHIQRYKEGTKRIRVGNNHIQAAPSLKSVVSALYLLTVAFGDLIIVAITQLNIFSNLVRDYYFSHQNCESKLERIIAPHT